MSDLVLDYLAAAGSAIPPEWTVVSSSQTSNITQGSTVSFPAGYQAGDAVLAIHVVNGGFGLAAFFDSPGPPSGWREALSFGTGTENRIIVNILNKISTETNYTFNGLQSTGWKLILVVIRPSATMPFLAASLISTANASNLGLANDPNPPPIVTSLSRNYIFAVSMSLASTTLSPPAGYTTIIANNTTGTYTVAYKLQTGSGTEDPGAMKPSGSLGLNGSTSATFAVRTKQYELDNSILDFSSLTTDVGGTQLTSATQTVFIESSLGNSTTSVSITGGSSPQYKINNGSWVSTSGTVSNGDTITIRANAATGTTGTTTSVNTSLTIGSRTANVTLITRRQYTVKASATTANVQNFTVTSGITSISSVAVGGGGGSGNRASNTSANNQRGGGGGGGGAFVQTTLSVSGGQVLTITAGGGGPDATAGGDSSIVRSGVTLVLAKGGAGGTSATQTTNGSGGAGGSAASSVGTTKSSGGNGGNGIQLSGTGTSVAVGGGGGGAGGYTTGSGGAGASSAGGSGGTGTSTGSGAGGGMASGGGGTGVSGVGTTATGGTGEGAEGSPDSFASNASGGGGGAGGGGAGGTSSGSNGGEGIVRLTW